MRVLEHMANGSLSLEVVQTEARTGGKFGHVDNFDGKLLAGLSVNTSSYQ